MFSRSPLDWGLVLAYFAFLAAVWRWRWRSRPTALDYMVAGRRVTLPAFVATLVTTWYGGILGVGEYSYRYGLANWLVFGVPYYIGALLFALFFARRARRAALYTVPDLLDRHYGRAPALAGALAVFILSSPSAYVLMLGTLFAAMFRLPLVPCVLGAGIFSIFYIQRGGLRSVVFTDQVQFVLMYAGFFLIVGFLVARHGGLPFLHQHLPPAHFTWNGGNPASAILVWYVIALSTLIDPGFWQRAYAARDPEVARNGVLVSIVCWAVFDFLTTATGLYARALLPHLQNPVFAYPELARITLPPLALGLFYLAMIATVMSTIDSYGFIAATTIGRDVVWRLRPHAGEENIPRWSRAGLWLATAFACALALAQQSVVEIWRNMGSIVTPALLLPVGTALLARGRIAPRWTLAAMVLAFAVSLAWVLAGSFPLLGRPAAYPWSLQPIYAGLAVSLLVYAAGWIASKGARPMKSLALLLLGAALLPGLAHAAPATAATAGTAGTDTLRHIVRLPLVEVSTTRDARLPVTRTVIARPEIERRNWGQDTPMALTVVPGTYAYSDAGNGIGYSYLSIRGFPQRRISVLVNGVPLNDPESHEVYWIDHPDLLASTSEVQVQRGVGSALYGGASLGGSVNLETSPFGDERRLTALFAYGSYDTQRIMTEFDSGRLGGDWNLYGRYSRIHTDGYRDQSYSRLWSYYFSARKEAGAHALRLNLYGGPEETHLAYLGVPREVLDVDRRFNPLTYRNERDHFFEPHYELIHSWAPSARVSLSQTLFYFDGSGYYDEQRFGRELSEFRLAPWATADSTLLPRDDYAQDASGALTRDASGRYTVERFDVVRRRWVANRHFGWVPRLRVEHARGAITVGGEIRHHDGHHWGEVVTGNGLPPGTEPNHTYYDYHPRTLAAGLFAREEFRLADPWLLTADLAWRHQGYFMRDDRFDGVRFDQPYDFAVPRLGVTWSPTERLTAYASWAHARREPAFRDLYDAEGPGSLPLYRHVDVAAGIYQDPLIRPERVHDFELGGAWRGHDIAASAHLFRMNFADELVYAGQFNTDLGFPILGNAAKSIHQGLELAARWERGGERLGIALAGNGTLSDNHFVRYREIYGTSPGDTVSYDGKALGLFPDLLGNLQAQVRWRVAARREATLGAEVQHVGRIYVDNTESRAASIAPHAVLNLTAGVRLPLAGTQDAALTVRLLNALDRKYETSGYMDYDAAGNLVPQLIPAATRNVLAELRVSF